jgi:hypothetical protein
MLASGQQAPLSPDTVRLIDRVWKMIGHPFVALHVAALYVTADDAGGLERCKVAITEGAPDMNRGVSLTLVSALSQFAAGDPEGAHAKLASLSPATRVGIGGSNVERELVELIDAACAAAQR